MENSNQIKEQFAEKMFTAGQAHLAYRLFAPEMQGEEQLPLVVYLHGVGERGSDTMLVLKNSGPVDLAQPDWQAQHPCYILAPQCPADKMWADEDMLALLQQLIGNVCGQYAINDNRIYLTGLSMGGIGTWSMITKYPDLFAAAMPICGGGVPQEIGAAKSMPIWAFHGVGDPVIPISGPTQAPFAGYHGTRSMILRLRSWGRDHVHYTEYPAGYLEQEYGVSPHAAWVAAYSDTEALEWLFAQDRTQRYDVEFVMPGIWQIGDCWYGTHFYVLEGKDKALVIDTGMVTGDMTKLVEALTHLPYQMIATHVHYDHLNNSDQFGKFYMSKKDMPFWDFYMSLLPDNTSTPEDVIDVKDGEIISLGGGVDIEIFELGGHSPGSLMLIDRHHNVCFAGDTVGNGENAYLQVPGSLNLSEFKVNVDRFLAYLEKEGLNDIVFLGGHRRQEWNYPENTRYNPLCRELLEDMSTLCTMIINDEVDIQPSPISFANSVTLTASHGMAKILFQEENKK